MIGEEGASDVFGRNSMRLVEAWLDDYKVWKNLFLRFKKIKIFSIKRIYYYNRPDLKDKNFGDISSRLAIRDRLKCKNFKWYLHHVYPEKFILDENVIAYGDISVVNTDKCLDTMGVPEGYNKEVGIYNCQNGQSIFQVT